jgi:L-ascorbate oxidase
MARGTLWNLWTLSDDAVELRSFNGGDLPTARFVGPTFRVRPGDVLRLRLENRLSPCEEMSAHGACINDTNIHTHGLWVSPAGNSDNVLISVRAERSTTSTSSRPIIGRYLLVPPARAW